MQHKPQAVEIASPNQQLFTNEAISQISPTHLRPEQLTPGGSNCEFHIKEMNTTFNEKVPKIIDKGEEKHAYDSVNYGNYSGASEMLKQKPNITFNSNLESLPIPSQWRGGSQGDIPTPVTLGLRPVEPRPNLKQTQMAPWVKRFQP